MGMTKLTDRAVIAVDVYECGECTAEFVMFQRGDEPIYCPFCGKQLDLES